MLFRKKAEVSGASLEPFVINLKEGHLIGLAADPKQGSPCSNCIRNWLVDRNVYAEPGDVDSLTPQMKQLLKKLEEDKSPHIFYEVLPQGSPTKLECLVFPHPLCGCQKGEYVAPPKIHHNTNLAFSPIFQIKCVRYGTPGGNLWHFCASGQTASSYKLVTAFGAHPDKETARLQALDNWLKKAAITELPTRLQEGDLATEDFFTAKPGLISEATYLPSLFKGIGVGGSKEEATLDALFSLSKFQIVRQYATSGKNPMLVVGSNSWLRNKVPFSMLQQYDLYMLFYPNQSPSWVVGLVAFSRLNPNQKPVFVFESNANVAQALDMCVFRILQEVRLSDWKKDNPIGGEKDATPQGHSKMNMWWTHWIYRCPKISLKDVLHLEPHPRDITMWRNYLHEVVHPIRLIHLNDQDLPQKVRHLVKLHIPDLEARAPQVEGIGTWSSFGDSVLQI